MNIFNKVTLQTLKKNRVRTVVTIIGIILSAAMICAVTTFVSSMQNYALQHATYVDGDWHGCALDANGTILDRITSSDKIEHSVYAQQIGYAYAEGSKNEFKPYLYILGTSADFENVMPIHLLSGSYPTSSEEIILPEHLYVNGGVKCQLGDTLTLEIGQRMSDGFSLGQSTPNFIYVKGESVVQDETLEIFETRTYTVVGFYERPSFEDYSAPGYTAITLADAAPAEDAAFDVYFKMDKAKEIYDFMADNHISGKYNTDVLAYAGLSRFDNFSKMLRSIAAIFIALIIFGSVSLIYNAFSISVSERTKQFGLLSSVGATKKQLRRMVLFEALAVSAVGIPLGILSGIGGIGVTLLIIGNKFTSLLGSPIPMRVCVSPLSVVFAVIIAVVTVLISAWVPSRRATKVSAVEAIRQSSDISIKRRTVKTSKLTYLLFGLPGMLASKHYKRNRKKYRTTVLSLFMSIVLFVSTSAFTSYLMDAATSATSTSGYDIQFSCAEGQLTDTSPDELLETLSTAAEVTDSAYVMRSTVVLEMPVSVLSEKYLSYFAESDSDTRAVSAQVYFVNDAKFEELLDTYKLKQKGFTDPDEPLAITIDGNVIFDQYLEKYVSLNVLTQSSFSATATYEKDIEGYTYLGQIYDDDSGKPVHQYVGNNDPEDILNLTDEEALQDYTLRSGAVIYDVPFYIDSNNIGPVLLYPESMKDAVLPESVRSVTYRFLFDSDNHAISFNSLTKLVAENGFDTQALYDYAQNVESDRNMVIIIKVFSYGFIVLISLISAANVFNTISTNISLRRREFAMLKSVGMTPRGFNRMMNFECVLYGSRSLLFGLPVSLVISYLIHLALATGYSADYVPPYGALLVATLSVFAVVFATMLYAMSKIKRDNPIDALKNENL
ncbi:MAG: ABC transporter permease [Oscillospiraceae bacterium]|nr:ABC transporter permease [Oscillospiraceae bacterium]